MYRSTFIQLFLLLLLTYVCSVSALKHLHLGPGPGESTRTLKAQTVSDEVVASDADEDLSFDSEPDPSRHVVDVDVKIRKDVLMWDELKDDGMTFHGISLLKSNGGARRFSYRLSGKNIDRSDFKRGAIFILQKDTYEEIKGEAFPESTGVDPDDPIAFFRIEGARFFKSGGKINLTFVILVVENISGDDVIPEVDFSVREENVSPDLLPKKVVYQGQKGYVPWKNNLQNSADNNLSGKFSVLKKADHTFSRKVDVSKNVKLSISGGVTPKITNFKLKRLIGLKFEWDQSLSAFLNAKVEMKKTRKEKRTGELVKIGIPKISIKFSFPVIGKFFAGGFVGVNWISEVKAEGKAAMRFFANYERRERVKAQLSPPKFEAKNTLPANIESTATGSQLTAEAEFEGFFGIRPVLGIGASFKRKRLFRSDVKKSVDGNVGANIGLEMSTQIQTPAFPPFKGNGLKLGVCDRCHSLRGDLSFSGKKLSVQLTKNGKINKEIVIIKNLFEIPIATACALETTCGVLDVALPLP